MEPQIRYCTTTNGISIAYWTMGQGPPLLITPPFGFSHIQLELEDAEIRAWYERLANNHTVVRFDLLSNGLSQRGLTADERKSTPVCGDYDAVVSTRSRSTHST